MKKTKLFISHKLTRKNMSDSGIEGMTSPVEVRGKVYTYKTKTGKEKKIYREWKVSSAKQQRNQEINDYFRDNAERIRGMKNIKQVMRDFNETHDTQASYNIIYKKYTSIFNTRKSRTKHEPEVVSEKSEREDKNNEGSEEEVHE